LKAIIDKEEHTLLDSFLKDWRTIAELGYTLAPWKETKKKFYIEPNKG
jgi:hypothetical protein